MFHHRSKITKYLFLAFVLALLVYAYFEARNILYGPQITLAHEGALTVNEELIEIGGVVQNVVEITLDGRAVVIDDTGAFTERLLLAHGLNRFTFEARDKFGHTTQETIEVVYTPPSEPEHPTIEPDTIEASLE